MENFRTNEEILSGATECYGHIGAHSSIVFASFRTGVNWSDNHPRKGVVDINKAREWVKNAFIGTLGEGLANIIADEFVKAMEE